MCWSEQAYSLHAGYFIRQPGTSKWKTTWNQKIYSKKSVTLVPPLKEFKTIETILFFWKPEKLYFYQISKKIYETMYYFAHFTDSFL